MSLPRSCTATEASRRGLAALWLACVSAAHAAPGVGTVVNLSGPLLVHKADGRLRLLAVQSAVEPGDTLVTEKASHVRIRFADAGELTLQPDSRLAIEHYGFDASRAQGGAARLVLSYGGVHVRTGALVRLQAPGGSIEAQGGEFFARVVPSRDGLRDALAAWRTASIAWMEAGLPSGTCCASDAGEGAPVADALRLAQLSPGQNGSLTPGLYVHVIDGLIQLSNRGGVQQFSAGQFGYTGSVVQAPVIVPQNPGIQFNPPPAFSTSAGPTSTATGSTPKTVDCEVR